MSDYLFHVRRCSHKRAFVSEMFTSESSIHRGLEDIEDNAQFFPRQSTGSSHVVLFDLSLFEHQVFNEQGPPLPPKHRHTFSSSYPKIRIPEPIGSSSSARVRPLPGRNNTTLSLSWQIATY